ncbi:MAG: alkaline phosphatase D family protein, partial [Pseudomonadales bacterium]
GDLGKCFCNDDLDNDGVVDNPLLDPNCEKLVNETDIYKYGLKAWHEYNPIREEEYGQTGDARIDNKNKLYRYRTFGKDAAMFLLDTRSFRDENVSLAGQDLFTLPSQAYQAGRTILGKAQLNELLEDLRKADDDGITWKFIMVPEPIQHLGVVGAADRFEGFAHERAILLEMIENECIDNVVFISGDIHGTVVNNLAYQNPADVVVSFGRPLNLQRFSYSWDISTGPVAYEGPIGTAVTGEENPPTDEQQRKNFDSTFKDRMDLQLRALGRPRTGLGSDIFIVPPLQQKNKSIPATLGQGFDESSYVSGHSFGWTEFQIDSGQNLKVITWGMPWYKEGGSAQIAEPLVKLNEFVVTPFSPQDIGANCFFDTECTSCRCAPLSSEGVLNCAAKLANGSFCAIDSQCASDRCAGLPPTCQDTLPNDSSCVFDVDCQSGRCAGLPPICQDKKTNGSICLNDNDCVSENCSTGFCRPSPNGQSCIRDNQCISGRCTVLGEGLSQCQDKEPTGNACLLNSDCLSGICSALQCVSSLDMRANGEGCVRDSQCSSDRCTLLGEGVFECRAKQPNGGACLINNDCINGDCAAGFCRPAPDGTFCLTNNQCSSNRCTILGEGVSECRAKQPNGGACLVNNDCINGDCAAGYCRPSPNGTFCVIDNQCSSGRCVGVGPSAECRRKLQSGESCTFNVDCLSNSCSGVFNRTCD